MARVAIVTGATRGMGRAISIALRGAGHRVAAVYQRDVDAARRCSDESAIPAYKWNVADFQACHYGLLQVERDLGPVDILINNAGIIEDAMLHRMTHEQWMAVIHNNLGSMFNMARYAIEGIGRLGAPADVGRMAAFLASDDAGCITGATLDVNGGQFMG